MARTLYLHAGAMKSGTSFIQNVLFHNREALLEQGLRSPGKRWQQQVRGVNELIRYGGDGQPPMPPKAVWPRLVRQVDEHPGDAVISMEFIGPRSPAKIRQLLADFPGADVQVVFTVRDLARSIPAMWQESVQNGSVCTWPDFLEEVRAERSRGEGPGRWFWKHQGFAPMLARWQKVVGNDHLTVVTVPPAGSGSGLLWERFASVLGIDPSSCDLSVRGNPSIGAASAMLMRELNAALKEDPLAKEVYHRRVKHVFAKQGLAGRATPESNLGLDAGWVRRRGRQEVERLGELGLRIVGDLDDLTPRPVPGVPVDGVTADEQLAAAVDGLAFLLRTWPERRNPRPKSSTEPA